MDRVLKVDIPEWAKNRTIYIFAGIELLAYRLPGENWQFKTGQCNRCGKCCMGLKKHSLPLIDGQCVFLTKEPGKDNPQWLCGLGINRPFGCCIGIPQNTPDCTEKFEEVI